MKLSELGYADLSSVSTPKLLAVLTKTERSLQNHIRRGNQPGGMRSMELIDRFEAARQEIQERDYNLWKQWCDERNCDYGASAYDYFA